MGRHDGFTLGEDRERMLEDKYNGAKLRIQKLQRRVDELEEDNKQFTDDLIAAGKESSDKQNRIYALQSELQSTRAIADHNEQLYVQTDLMYQGALTAIKNLLPETNRAEWADKIWSELTRIGGATVAKDPETDT